MRKIVLTGPESTGKSELTSTLANHFKLPFVKEVARKYLNCLDTPYKKSDLTTIAKLQMEEENKIAQLYPSTLFCDTDLLTIKIWSEFKYNSCDNYIITQLKARKPDLYLVCKPDIPWEDDPLREHPGHREELFQIHLNEIDKMDVPYRLIDGLGEKRIISAINAIL